MLMDRIIKYVKSGNIKSLRTLIRTIPNLPLVLLQHQTDNPFSIACSLNNIAIVNMFLQSKVNPNIGSNEQIPIVIACKNSNIELAKLLLQNGVYLVDEAKTLSFKFAENNVNLTALLTKHIYKPPILDTTSKYYAICTAVTHAFPDYNLVDISDNNFESILCLNSYFESHKSCITVLYKNNKNNILFDALNRMYANTNFDTIDISNDPDLYFLNGDNYIYFDSENSEFTPAHIVRSITNKLLTDENKKCAVCYKDMSQDKIIPYNCSCSAMLCKPCAIQLPNGKCPLCQYQLIIAIDRNSEAYKLAVNIGHEDITLNEESLKKVIETYFPNQLTDIEIFIHTSEKDNIQIYTVESTNGKVTFKSNITYTVLDVVDAIKSHVINNILD